MKQLLLVLALFLVTVPGIAADTGTYDIEDYRVSLEPQSDGTVEIGYYMKWSVTGGHIPWITVGLPNDNFTIEESGCNIQSIVPDNAGDWSGVRIDLDRDYMPGESFEVSFKVTQNKLLYAKENDYKLDFTPGWYDNANTGKLTIKVHFFTKLEDVKTDPAPSSIEDEVMTWERTDLGRGERFNISISFPKATFKTPLPQENLREESIPDWLALAILIIVAFIIIIAIGVRNAGSPKRKRRRYSGGGIFYGGGYGGSGGRGHGGRGSGGGGGFGGRSSGCACACVSCACACACAGGGGAGCSRKTRHSCPSCRRKNAE